MNEIFELKTKIDSGVETYEWRSLDSKVSISNVKSGSKIRISTPGGGGFTYK